MKTVYFDCDCKGFHCTVRFCYFPDEKDYLYLETHLTEVGFFKRCWRAIRYVFGMYTPYNETVLNKEEIVKVRDTLDEFLNYSIVPEQSRALFDWMYKYDPQLAGRPKSIIETLINKGAEQLYKEGLENAEPLPKEVYDAMAEASKRALAEALKDE